MERALYLTGLDSPHRDLLADYDRLYYGAEFCEIKIPDPKETAAAIVLARQTGADFTLVTPYVTDRGLKALAEVFEILPKEAGLEVIFNDYGALRLLKMIRPEIPAVLGRLLSNQKRGFGISSRSGDADEGLVREWRHSGADTNVVREYLEAQGVVRIELDNIVQGIASDLSLSPLSASLYYPYGYVTTTRYCPWAFDGQTWPNLGGVCSRRCLQGIIEEKAEIFNRDLFLAGNAQFFRNDAVPSEAELAGMGIDRVVFEPDIPV
jgi:hypothetical protein